MVDIHHILCSAALCSAADLAWVLIRLLTYSTAVVISVPLPYKMTRLQVGVLFPSSLRQLLGLTVNELSMLVVFCIILISQGQKSVR